MAKDGNLFIKVGSLEENKINVYSCSFRIGFSKHTETFNLLFSVLTCFPIDLKKEADEFKDELQRRPIYIQNYKGKFKVKRCEVIPFSPKHKKGYLSVIDYGCPPMGMDYLRLPEERKTYRTLKWLKTASSP